MLLLVIAWWATSHVKSDSLELLELYELGITFETLNISKVIPKSYNSNESGLHKNLPIMLLLVVTRI